MRETVHRPALALVTLVDLIALLSLASAAVLVLGSRSRFFLGPVLVTMPDPERLLIFAALAVFIRGIIGRGLAWLPGLRVERLRPTSNADRERFAAPARATREVMLYALAAASASLVWLLPHIANIRQVPDVGDPIYYPWQIARLARQLLHDPRHLFDGNIFHPATNSLTYADPTILQAALAFPFVAAGTDPLVVSNSLLIASFPISALAFFYAGWRLTADPQAGCIAGILGGVSAFKVEHYSHLELQFFCFAPLAVVALLRMLAAPSWRTGATFGSVITAQWLAGMYLGLMQLLFLAPVAWCAVAAWGWRPTRAHGLAALGSAVVIILGSSITVVPFLKTREDRGERPIQQVEQYSARPADYAAVNERLLMYRGITPAGRNKPERELFPGGLPLVMAAAGALPPMSVSTLALIASSSLAFEASLGTNGLLYRNLHRELPPFRGMRVPARFAAFVGTGLILLSAFGANRVIRRGRTRAAQMFLFALLAAGALIDGRHSVRLQPYYASIPPIYARVTSNMVLAELPMAPLPNLAYMYFSTSHWARLINGHSSYWPPGYLDLERAAGRIPDHGLLERLRTLGTTHITVNCKFSTPQICPRVLEALDAMPQLERIAMAAWEGAEVRLYTINGSQSQ